MMAPGFTGSPLDRADRVRNDAEAYGALLGDLRARVLGLDGLDQGSAMQVACIGILCRA